MEISFTKGHGTLNDFVLIADEHDELQLSMEQVAFLCDRRAGIGADGLIRAVRSPGLAEWFMDYRNADGSLAEMCGNGLRVFAKYLVESGLAVGPHLTILTRAGIREAELLADGQVRVSLGQPTVDLNPVSVSAAGESYVGWPVDVGNPHVVCPVPVGTLADLVVAQPSWSPTERFPDGVNVEWVEHTGAHLSMRVYERGVGETCSCGTGTVAVAAWAATRTELREFRVRVPGGDVSVQLSDEQAFLTGPAELVATGTVSL